MASLAIEAERPRLAFLDRYLTIWIFAAMALGIAIGSTAPAVPKALDAMSFGSTSIPIAVGLILMMFPPLAKVRYEELGKVLRDGKILALSFTLCWIVAPAFMFALASLLLGDRPEYLTGLVLIGIAPCIAMVLVWNQLAQAVRNMWPVWWRSIRCSRSYSMFLTPGSTSPCCRRCSDWKRM